MSHASLNSTPTASTGRPGGQRHRVAVLALDDAVPLNLTIPLEAFLRAACPRLHPAGRTFEVLPLVHPGQRGRTWTEAHDRWVAGTTV